MSDPDHDGLRESLLAWVGKSPGHDGPAEAPDPVNIPMIRHSWLFPRPKIDGIGGRRGMPTGNDRESPIRARDRASYIGSLMTSSEIEFMRYLMPAHHEKECTVAQGAPRTRRSETT